MLSNNALCSTGHVQLRVPFFSTGGKFRSYALLSKIGSALLLDIWQVTYKVLLPLFLHTASDQKLEAGEAQEQG